MDGDSWGWFLALDIQDGKSIVQPTLSPGFNGFRRSSDQLTTRNARVDVIAS